MPTETRPNLMGAAKIALDTFTNNVICAGRGESGPFIAKTSGEIISLDSEGNGSFVVHVSKIGDSRSSKAPRFRISNPGVISSEFDVDKYGQPYRRLEFSGKGKQVIIYERR